MPEQQINELAAVFRALGDPTRLRIFEFLCSLCGPVAVDDEGRVRPVLGATVGEVCCCVTGVERATSTISFHLKELRQAGLIAVERRGRHLVCSARTDTLETLRRYLGERPCCEARADEGGEGDGE